MKKKVIKNKYKSKKLKRKNYVKKPETPPRRTKRSINEF